LKTLKYFNHWPAVLWGFAIFDRFTIDTIGLELHLLNKTLLVNE